MRKKVALIFGGRSLENEISIITAMQVLNNIDKKKYGVESIYMYEGEFYAGNLNNISKFSPFVPTKCDKLVLYRGVFYTIKKNTLQRYYKPDVAFLCGHGGEGENGVIQSILQYNDISFVSSKVLQSSICIDKARAKDLFDSMLMNTIPHEVIFRKEYYQDKEKITFHLESFLNYPLIVKPSSQGSSIGIAVANNRNELLLAIDIACKFDSKLIVEQKLVDYIETNCAAFKSGDKIIVSETEQPLTFNDFLTFDDKYLQQSKASTESRKKVDIEGLDQIIKANTERAYRELDLSGIVRIDYLVDRIRNKIYINEINTIPGSMAYYLFEPIGIDFKTLISLNIENCMLECDENRCQHIYKTDVLLHYKNNMNKAGRNKNRRTLKG